MANETRGHMTEGDALSATHELDSERTKYAQAWTAGNAKGFEQQGHYVWMAGSLDASPLICEIGTGDGRATVELLRRGHVVVSIDENPECILVAQERIAAAGFTVARVLRGTVMPALGGYSITYDRMAGEVPAIGALLIEGDTRSDPSLLAWLERQSFDGVAAWLIGSHEARMRNVAFDEVLTEEEYRLSTIAATCQLAAAILRTDGLISIVDRLRIPDAIDEQRYGLALRKAYGELMNGTGLHVEEDPKLVRYTPVGGVRMVHNGALGAEQALVPHLVCATARKTTLAPRRAGAEQR